MNLDKQIQLTRQLDSQIWAQVAPPQFQVRNQLLAQIRFQVWFQLLQQLREAKNEPR